MQHANSVPVRSCPPPPSCPSRPCAQHLEPLVPLVPGRSDDPPLHAGPSRPTSSCGRRRQPTVVQHCRVPGRPPGPAQRAQRRSEWPASSPANRPPDLVPTITPGPGKSPACPKDNDECRARQISIRRCSNAFARSLRQSRGANARSRARQSGQSRIFLGGLTRLPGRSTFSPCCSRVGQPRSSVRPSEQRPSAQVGEPDASLLRASRASSVGWMQPAASSARALRGLCAGSRGLARACEGSLSRCGNPGHRVRAAFHGSMDRTLPTASILEQSEAFPATWAGRGGFAERLAVCLRRASLNPARQRGVLGRAGPCPIQGIRIRRARDHFFCASSSPLSGGWRIIHGDLAQRGPA